MTQSRLFYPQRFLFRRRNDSQDYAKYQLLEIISFLKYKIVMYPTKSISFYAGKWKTCSVFAHALLRILARFECIRVYSFLTLLGHDLGIEAILVVLGIQMDHHVPYASRLVFEYWTEKKTETTKIRKRFSTSDYQLIVSYNMSILYNRPSKTRSRKQLLVL